MVYSVSHKQHLARAPNAAREGASTPQEFLRYLLEHANVAAPEDGRTPRLLLTESDSAAGGRALLSDYFFSNLPLGLGVWGEGDKLGLGSGSSAVNARFFGREGLGLNPY